MKNAIIKALTEVLTIDDDVKIDISVIVSKHYEFNQNSIDTAYDIAELESLCVLGVDDIAAILIPVIAKF